jgi:hypothetical protein
MGWVCSRDETDKNASRIIIRKPEKNRSFERPKRRWENNIKIDLQGIEYEGVGWINLAQDRDQ